MARVTGGPRQQPLARPMGLDEREQVTVLLDPGWEVELTWHGLPKRWKPLLEGAPGLPASGWRIDAVKEQERVRLERRQMLAKGTNTPGVTLKRTMELAIGP